MNLSAPKKWTFIIGAVIWLIGLIALFVIPQDFADPVKEVTKYGIAVWMGFIGGLIVMLGNLLEGF